jgi:carbonic anhydrase
MFGSERQNVIKACEIVRSSPLIGPRIPVHGLLLDIQTGKLEWLVNGYQAWATMGSKWDDVVRSAGETVDKLKPLMDFNIGEMKFPETKIGETVTKATDWLSQKVESLQRQPTEAPPSEFALPPKAANIAARIVDTAEKHWPRLAAPTARPSPKPPIPPPIRGQPQSPKRGRN